MVFCFKAGAEHPRRHLSEPRSLHSEPQRRSRSPMCRVPIFPSTVDQLINQLEGGKGSDMQEIQEKDWRLLAALARKREDDQRQEQLANQLHHVWRTEREQREVVEAETNEYYKRYIEDKRELERRHRESRQFEGLMEEQARRRYLVESIRHKERKTASNLAHMDGKKATDLIDASIEENARALLAAARRSRLDEMEQCRRQMELVEASRKADCAGRRRSAFLKDNQQRVAINNALSSWESTILKQEVAAMDEARRAHHAARAALHDARSARLAHARETSLQRSRRVAALTAQLREVVKNV